MNFDEFMRAILFLPDAASQFADDIDHLHFFVIVTTMFGSAAVGFLALYWLVRYRRRGKPSATPHVSPPAWFEISWIGGLLTLFILFWVLGFRQYISYATPPKDAEEVYVTAKQWMWKFAHPSGRSSVGVLVVPEGRKVRLIMTSRDVIHSFYVPAFRIKQDVLPGRYTNAWFEARAEGIYPVYCTEFCGTFHSRMWASVVVLSASAYERWLEGEVPESVAQAGRRLALGMLEVRRVDTLTEVDMAEAGKTAAADYGCFSCHTIDGQPHIGPTWRGLFGKRVQLEDGKTVVADEQYLTRSMMDPQGQIVAGYRPVMPTYLGQLPQPEAAAIVEFIKSLEHEHARPSIRLPETQVLAEGSAGAPGRSNESKDENR